MKNKEKLNEFEFVNIRGQDVNNFISFLTDVRPDYPYRWFFDRMWGEGRVDSSPQKRGPARARFVVAHAHALKRRVALGKAGLRGGG